jgi:putative holliday junction resolvase
MRVAAIDLGKVRVGVAISDELGLLAHPRAPLSGKNQKDLVTLLGRMARAEGIDRFLVGLPLDQKGLEGPAAQRARRFAQWLSNATGKLVELVDERLTTVEASRRLRDRGVSAKQGRGKIDGEAAAVFLQMWLDKARAGQACDP